MAIYSSVLFLGSYKARQNILVFIAFTFILIADIFIRMNSFIGISNGSTEIVAVLNFITVISLLTVGKSYGLRKNIPNTALLIFTLFMLWNVITLFRGAVNAVDYWDWKVLLLNYSFSILVPLAIVAGVHFEFLIKTFRFILNKLFLFGLVLIPITFISDSELYARIMMAVSLFILFIPYLKYQWRMLVIIVALISMMVDMSYRVNVLRIIFSLILVFIFYFRRGLTTNIFNFALGVMLLMPLFLLYLGVNNHFNIFTDGILNAFHGEVISIGGGEISKSDLSADTRTFLYQEVFRSMIYKGSSFLIGEGAASGYLTIFFDSAALNARGRYLSEVGFLNMVLNSGAIGVALYALMLFVPAYYAINRSQNYLCKMFGLFLAFHWIIYFIEDITKLDVNYFCIWVAIGLCLSNKFRAMSDSKLKQFFEFKVVKLTNGFVRDTRYRMNRCAESAV